LCRYPHEPVPPSSSSVILVILPLFAANAIPDNAFVLAKVPPLVLLIIALGGPVVVERPKSFIIVSLSGLQGKPKS